MRPMLLLLLLGAANAGGGRHVALFYFSYLVSFSCSVFLFCFKTAFQSFAFAFAIEFHSSTRALKQLLFAIFAVKLRNLKLVRLGSRSVTRGSPLARPFLLRKWTEKEPSFLRRPRRQRLGPEDLERCSFFSLCAAARTRELAAPTDRIGLSAALAVPQRRRRLCRRRARRSLPRWERCIFSQRDTARKPQTTLFFALFGEGPK